VSVTDLIQGRARSDCTGPAFLSEGHPPRVPSVYDWEPQDGYCTECGTALAHDTRARTWACLRCLTVVWTCDEWCGRPGSSCRWLTSQQNIDTARRMAEAFDRGDYETATGCFRADAVWHNTASFPGPTTCTGSGEIVEFWRGLFDEFEGGEMLIERVAAAGDSVVALIHSHARGKASGAPVDVRWALRAKFAGDEVVRVDVHGDQAKALEAAGLAD